MTSNLHPDIVEAIESADGSIPIADLPDGFAVEAQTRNTIYTIQRDGRITNNGDRVPSGDFHGCTFGGSMIKMGHVFVGGHIEFRDATPKTWTTSGIQRLDIARIEDTSIR